MKKLSELYKASAEHWRGQIREARSGTTPHIPIVTCPFCKDATDRTPSGDNVPSSCKICRIDKTICHEGIGDETIINLMFVLNRVKNVAYVISLGKILIKIFEDKAEIHKATEDICDILTS